MKRPSLAATSNEHSIYKSANFDWGWGSQRSLTSGPERSSDNGLSRHDPRTMDRIDDITDLVDSSDEEDDQSSEEYGHSSSLGIVSASDSFGNDSSRAGVICRQLIVVIGIVATIVCTSALIGVAITQHPLGDPSGAAPYIDDASTGDSGQMLLEKAERVMTACSEEKLYEDMSDCQSMCRRAMCCFEDPDSEYSCQDDPAHECAVFFGCEPLMEPPGYTSYDYDAALEEEMYNKEYEMESEIEMEDYQG